LEGKFKAEELVKDLVANWSALVTESPSVFGLTFPAKFHGQDPNDLMARVA
jgi:hypothetical protein